MFHCILYQPEIPPNTGNIIRLCANSGIHLHLIHPLGFDFDHKKLRRAGLDYHEFTAVSQYQNFDELLQKVNFNQLYACSTKGTATHASPVYQANDAFIFGPETRGLPAEILNHPRMSQIIRIPMQPDSRSMNLSNSVAIILFEAWRQLDFQHGT